MSTMTSPSTTNWSNFGMYKNIPANKETVRKAGAVFTVMPDGSRIKVRTKADRKALRKGLNFFRKAKATVAEVVETKVTYRVRLVKARIKTLNGKTLNRVCKVKGSDGTQKVFVTKKAALAWVKNQK